MRITKALVSVLVAALLVLSTFTVITPVAAATPAQGGNFVVDLVSEPTTLNPLTGAWNNGFVGAQILEPLLTYSSNLSIVPDLATSYSVNSADGTYTFNLRQGVTWSDGQPMTANDVKFSFEQVISKYDLFGAGYFANTTVSITNGGNSVVIKPGNFLPGVQLLLFASLDCAILPQHLLQGQNWLNSTFLDHPVGTGPFMLSQWVKGSYMTLDRNPHYWNGSQPYLSNITIKFITDPTALQAAVQSGSVDYVFRGIPYTAVNSFNSSGVRTVLSTRPPYATAIWFNVQAPVVSNLDVRKAIAYALNKTDIAFKATNGVAKPIDYMVDPSVVPPSPGITQYSYNVQMANSLLDQAGFPKAANGTRFSIELLSRTGAPDEAVADQIIKSELAQVGINVNIKTVDFGTYLTLDSKGQYQMSVISYWLSPIWTYQLFDSAWIGKGPFTNNFFYNSSATDGLFNQWLKASNSAQQTQLMQQVENQLSQDLPEIVLYGDVWINAINSNYQGSAFPVGRYVFFDSLASVYDTAMSTSATPAIDPLIYVAVAVIAIVIVAAAVMFSRRGRSAKGGQTQAPQAAPPPPKS